MDMSFIPIAPLERSMSIMRSPLVPDVSDMGVETSFMTLPLGAGLSPFTRSLLTRDCVGRAFGCFPGLTAGTKSSRAITTSSESDDLNADESSAPRSSIASISAWMFCKETYPATPSIRTREISCLRLPFMTRTSGEASDLRDVRTEIASSSTVMDISLMDVFTGSVSFMCEVMRNRAADILSALLYTCSADRFLPNESVLKVCPSTILIMSVLVSVSFWRTSGVSVFVFSESFSELCCISVDYTYRTGCNNLFIRVMEQILRFANVRSNRSSSMGQVCVVVRVTIACCSDGMM